jgi:hypothetical protein
MGWHPQSGCYGQIARRHFLPSFASSATRPATGQLPVLVEAAHARLLSREHCPVAVAVAVGDCGQEAVT